MVQDGITFLTGYQKRLFDVARQNEKKIVDASKFVDKPELNRVKPPIPSHTEEEAVDEARYRATKLGQSFNEGHPLSQDQVKEIKEKLVAQYAREFIGSIFKGS